MPVLQRNAKAVLPLLATTLQMCINPFYFIFLKSPQLFSTGSWSKALRHLSRSACGRQHLQVLIILRCWMRYLFFPFWFFPLGAMTNVFMLTAVLIQIMQCLGSSSSDPQCEFIFDFMNFWALLTTSARIDNDARPKWVSNLYPSSIYLTTRV